MGIVPKAKDARITFYQAKLPKLAENANLIGTSPEAVTALAAEVEAARLAYQAQLQAQLAARTATQALKIAIDEMNAAGSAIILQVRAKAQSSGDGSVYNLASLPAPATRSRRGTPGTPVRLTAELAVGSLVLKWACSNPRGSPGTLYHVSRRMGDAGPFDYLGASGEKRYVDPTIPKGATHLEYEIQAVRSTAKGEAARFPVTFGSNGQAPLPSFTPSARLAA